MSPFQTNLTSNNRENLEIILKKTEKDFDNLEDNIFNDVHSELVLLMSNDSFMRFRRKILRTKFT